MITVRKLRKQDLKDFVRLYNEWNKTRFSVQQMNKLVSRSKSNTVLFAFLNGSYAGFITFSMNWDIEEGGLKAELTDFYVDKRFRKQGVGSRLIGSALKECKKRGARRVVLGTESSNKTAHKLYRDYGFRKMGVLFFDKKL